MHAQAVGKGELLFSVIGLDIGLTGQVSATASFLGSCPRFRVRGFVVPQKDRQDAKSMIRMLLKMKVKALRFLFLFEAEESTRPCCWSLFLC